MKFSTSFWFAQLLFSRPQRNRLLLEFRKRIQRTGQYKEKDQRCNLIEKEGFEAHRFELRADNRNFIAYFSGIACLKSG